MPEQLVVFKAYPEIEMYSSDMEYDEIHPDVASLLSLGFGGSEEEGIEPVVVEVTMSTAGQLLDVCFNDRSVGWHALSVFCARMCEDLMLPDVVARGTEEDCAGYAYRSDAIYYTVPLFGDADPVE